MNSDKDLFRQALQRQNERAARMKMPDDMEQRVMERIRPKKAMHRWLYPAIATVAASILLLLVIHFSQAPVKEQSVVTEAMEQEAIIQTVPQPIVEEKKDEVLAEARTIPQPVRKHRKAVRKQQMEPAEVIIPIETVEDQAITMEPTFNSYADIEAEMLNIRSRGECVEAMVADLTRSF